MIAALADALGLHIDLDMSSARRRASSSHRAVDPVHSAMGELEAAHLRPFGYRIAIDEPYQHFQFAGRADLLAWRDGGAALLHIENRTRFTDLQTMAGSFNAKRAYLSSSVADRLTLGRLVCVTHVIAALWSSEILHVLRMRTETLRALCPDPLDAFDAWWSGRPPTTGVTSSLILLDPFAGPRQARYVGSGAALAARPRVRGYAEAARRVGLG
jgi:hypothetical protein